MIKKKFIRLIYKLFKRKVNRLKEESSYRQYLKAQTKNKLIRIIINLQVQLSIEGRSGKRKVEKNMIKNQKERTKLLKKEMDDDIGIEV